jgi:hypothetical protein
MQQAEHSRNERMMTIATIAHAGVTFVLAIFTSLLRYANRTSVAQSARDTLLSITDASMRCCRLRKHGVSRWKAQIRVKSVAYKHGLYPAKNLRYRVTTAILDFPLPPDYQFSDSAKLSQYDVAFEPSAELHYFGIVASRHEEPDVEATMKGEHKRLFVWALSPTTMSSLRVGRLALVTMSFFIVPTTTRI